MKVIVKFVLALAIFGVTISGVSLIWKKLTSAQRPQALQQVHDLVIQTPQGSQAAQVFGVTDDRSTTPINIEQVATDVWNGIKNTIEKRTQTILVSQVTQQLMNQYEKLSEEQQLQLQQIICKPTTMVQ